MPSPKLAILGAVFSFAASPVLADASLVDALIVKKANKVISAKMNRDAKAPIFTIAIGTFGVVDKALGAHDADYEVVLSDRGMAIGAAVYGQYDAAYDVYLTPANFFEKAALGRHDAGYEAVLTERGVTVGAAVYGQYDAGYDVHFTPANFFETAALGHHDAGYEAVLKDRGIAVGQAVFGHNDADYEAVLFPQADGCQQGDACF